MRGEASMNIYAVAAKSEGEVLAHCITRTQFLKHILVDPRTRNVFSFWGEHFGIDPVVERFSGLLDVVGDDTDVNAASARRAVLQTTLDSLQPSTLDFLRECRFELERRLVESLLARTEFLKKWIVEDLFCADAPARVPMRAWLASDLLTVFDAEVRAHVRGDHCRLQVSRPPTLTAVPKGQRPKGQGEHLERNATWFYRSRVSMPRVFVEDLAEEYYEARFAASVTLAPRDPAGVRERPDTKLVRRGITDAQRLLSLTISPEQWLRYSTTIH